jgi:hypothetical protein
MATLDVTSASSALKVYYSDQRITQMMYQDAPLFALMPKVKDFYGKIYPLPMRVTNPQGRSNTFSNAQAQKTASVYKDFQLTRASDYSLASISSEAIMASETNPGAFLRLATAEIDGALMSLKRSLAWALYGDGSGALTVLAGAASISSANPAVITLQYVEDIVKFEVGQLIQARNGGTARVFATGVTTATVVAVDRDLGTITTGVDNSGNTDTFTTSTSLNVVGDYNVKLTGLAGWVPSTAPGATAFFSVDRSSDTTRLGGVRVTSSGKPMDEAFIDAARRLGREGGSPDYGVLGFGKYATLEKTLGSRVVYDDVEVANVSFRGIKISGPNRPFTIMPDRDCGDQYGYLLSMDTWGLYSLKEPVMLLDLDGNKMLREGTADSYEVRCASYSQVGCTFPGANAVMIF